jgi:spore germination cell wall hydrolase CwlJ-like protein
MLHSKMVAGLAATTATLVLAAGCTPDHIDRSASGVAQAAAARLRAKARPRLAIALDAPPAPPSPQTTPAAPTAQQLNAERPFARAPIEAMRPFVLKADAADRARAVACLSQAVYYEAAREPLKGQQAVAQVVLNRVRHPAYPKSVCGVVYQGAARATGCQFTFTCDGSLRVRPEPALWARAEEVARRALAGYVDPDVGSATHYHAVYVDPYWAPSLVKMTQVGQQIFYRWTGAWGEPAAFTGRYDGHEAHLTPAVLKSGDPRQPAAAKPELREVSLTVAGGKRTYVVADAAGGGGERSRATGVLQPRRRKATPEEAQRINDDLAALDKRLGGQAPDVTTAATEASATTRPAAAPGPG